MHTDKAQPRPSEFLRAFRFIDAARAIKTQRLICIEILLVLEEDLRQKGGENHGVTVATLANRVKASRETVRHCLRALRIESMVVLAPKRLSRTEFFTLSDAARALVAQCLNALEGPSV